MDRFSFGINNKRHPVLKIHVHVKKLRAARTVRLPELAHTFPGNGETLKRMNNRWPSVATDDDEEKKRK